MNVTVEGGAVTSIDINEESRSVMISTDEQLAAFLDAVVEAQSPEVDGISGATTETTALRTAIGMALASALMP